MRKLFFLPLAPMVLAAAGWTGILVDADCKQPGNVSACPVTVNTRHFGLVRSGFLGLGHHYYTLGSEGDERVLAYMADQQKKTGSAPTGSNVHVWFTGKPDGEKIAINDFAVKSR